MIYITAVRMSGGSQHAHIAKVMWLDGADGKSNVSTAEQMIEFIEKPRDVQVGGPKDPAIVTVVRTAGSKPYLRTRADGQLADNLLELPRF